MNAREGLGGQPVSHPEAECDTIPVVFIAGEGRSGSTVFEQILATDENFIALGEVRHVWHRGFVSNWLCGCGESFAECSFWAAVGREAFGVVEAENAREMLDLYRAVNVPFRLPNILARSRNPEPSASNDIGRYLEILRRIYRAVLSVSRRSIIIDSSKDGIHGFLLSRVPGVRLHVIHLVRDSRAVAFSWTRRKRRSEVHSDQDAVFMGTFSPSRSAVKWLYRNLAASGLKYVADSYCLVRYEDFVADPPQAINEVRRTMGLDDLETPEPDQPTRLPVVHSVSGNPSRVGRRTITLRLDDEWSRALSKSDYYKVTAITWLLMKRYGYPTH